MDVSLWKFLLVEGKVILCKFYFFVRLVILFLYKYRIYLEISFLSCDDKLFLDEYK